MCTHQRYVKNKYTGQKILVKCGHCNACKQEKADRLTARINNHCTDYDRVALMVTLTYKEEFVPYVRKKDLENLDLYELPIFRDYSIRRFKDRFIIRSCVGLRQLPIGQISLVDEKTGDVNRENIYFRPNLNKVNRGFHPEKMGVIYFKDIQDFKKRVRINLSREYGKGFGNVEFFCTTEYGETFGRPHAHVLVWCDRDSAVRVKSIICKSWPFSSYDDVARNTQFARNAASYVSSYVNSPANLPSCFTSVSKQKHSFSPTVGSSLHAFSLLEILEAANKGFITYDKETRLRGIAQVITLPIPKYVINRYFPLFKGLHRFTCDALDISLRFPSCYFRTRRNEVILDYNRNFRNGQLVDDIHSTIVRLRNAQKYYCDVTGKSIFDFAIDYKRVWNCYKNTLYRLEFDRDVPMLEHYDNVEQLKNGQVKNDSLAYYLKDDSILNPNDFSSVRFRSDSLKLKYHNKTKIAKTNNYVRASILNKDL